MSNRNPEQREAAQTFIDVFCEAAPSGVCNPAQVKDLHTALQNCVIYWGKDAELTESEAHFLEWLGDDCWVKAITDKASATYFKGLDKLISQ